MPAACLWVALTSRDRQPPRSGPAELTSEGAARTWLPQACRELPMRLFHNLLPHSEKRGRTSECFVETFKGNLGQPASPTLARTEPHRNRNPEWQPSSGPPTLLEAPRQLCPAVPQLQGWEGGLCLIPDAGHWTRVLCREDRGGTRPGLQLKGTYSCFVSSQRNPGRTSAVFSSIWRFFLEEG